MWKSLLLGLLVSLHTRIFLVFMRNYEAKSPLFMIKRAGLNCVPRQSYSKNSHGSYILKWILVLAVLKSTHVRIDSRFSVIYSGFCRFGGGTW